MTGTSSHQPDQPQATLRPHQTGPQAVTATVDEPAGFETRATPHRPGHAP